jgi:hypothetical protein
VAAKDGECADDYPRHVDDTAEEASAASISLVLAGPDDHIDKENTQEVPELQAA